MRKVSVISAAVLLCAFGLSDAQVRSTPAGAGSMSGQLSAAQGMIQKGEADRALKDIQANLNRYNSADLPTALFLSGQARAMLGAGADAKEKPRLYQQAALDYVKVMTFFPYSTEAPAAGLEAGRALAAGGDKASAKAVLGTAISRYGDSELAGAMKKELEKL